MTSLEHTLPLVIRASFSPDNNARREAENFLSANEFQPGFTLAILNLVHSLSLSNNPEDISIRQSASVLFKNIVNKRWKTDEEEKENIIPDGDREALKSHLVNLMCSTPPDVQKQLAEAVAVISKHDFPAKWDNLLRQLTDKILTKDIHVIKGVMLTANSIMKRFRYVFKNDNLYAELLYCLKQFQEPLLVTFQNFGILIQQYGSDRNMLVHITETLRLMARIFFSLNWQDIPEFFEDHLNDWMSEFAKYLTYTNPLLTDSQDRNEPGPIEKLQAAIVENLVLYVTKYEEEFASHLPHFTQMIWELLLKVGTEPKYDNLATNSIKFLASVSSKHMNMHLFNDVILKQIIEHIVVPNLTSTELDEELFQENPTDYIQKDMEGSDQDTRRRAACELVRALLKFFASQTSQLCIGYIDVMLTEYNKSSSWKAKDTALNLVLAVAVMTTTTGQGAGELNPHVKILEIFNSHVLPEIHDMNINARPIVKADAIKLVCLFRSHLNQPFMLDLLPHLIRFLRSEYVVVQTYAAMCIERFLSVKDRDPVTGKYTARVTREVITPYLNDLFSGLFVVLSNSDLPENDYVMKCIMRVLVLVETAITPVMELVLQQLTTALERVCKNPANPHFNHYLFESLAVLIRSSCSSTSVANAFDPAAASARMETLLFPSFQMVLSQDVTEFVPYVFQVLAQLLYFRPILPQGGLSEAYLALFPPLLSPLLWERKGNIPALVELVKAYVCRGIGDIVRGNHLVGVLGIFQKLLSATSSETSGFQLLENLIRYTPQQAMEPYLRTVMELLLRRLMQKKVPQFMRQVTHAMCLISAMYGGQFLFQLLESIQPDMTNIIIIQIWSQVAQSGAHLDIHVIRHIVVGWTKLACESAVNQNPQLWGSLIKLTVMFLDTEKDSKSDDLDEKVLMDEEHREFDSTYSRLAYAQIPESEPTPEMLKMHEYFATSLGSLCIQHPGSYSSVVEGVLDARGKLVLQGLLTQYGIVLK